MLAPFSDSPNSPLSPDEITRVERFIAAYNAIDNRLGQILGAEQTFRSSVDQFARQNPWWRDAETLRLFATIRNFLVHEKQLPFDYPVVPGEAAVREIEAIRQRFLRPATLGEEFRREVLVLHPRAPLQNALELIAQRGLSRFPIYENERFFGLLTENGVARFLAAQVVARRNFDAQTPIENVLPRETKRRNYRFAATKTPVSQAAYWFAQNTFLEAILISENGEQSRELIGIVTRGDVAGWSD